MKQALGSKVRAARKRAGITQEELATKIGKTPESISNIERGRQLPMVDTLAVLADVLAVPLSELFDDVGAPTQSPRRLRLEAHLREMVRGLDDDTLATAIEQMEVLARTLRR
ncbi:helix-turn-helix transcriptional regulator [Phenylobacterium sp.]|uniref:helix-turn-helix transcriptional regulator n=1 Tax=Phenylobacterium sp. TaxID=1871053 RepID=UPI0028A1CD0F|nr:helix-turn-helix transcriptional regulator [Phenylobacterium sp.]